MTQKFNAQNFLQEVLQSKDPVLVDFYADWCGPCKMMGPIVEQLSEAYAGKVKIGKVNVDEERDIARKYRIMSIPSFLLFKDGQVVDSAVGAVSELALRQMIEPQIA